MSSRTETLEVQPLSCILSAVVSLCFSSPSCFSTLPRKITWNWKVTWKAIETLPLICQQVAKLIRKSLLRILTRTIAVLIWHLFVCDPPNSVCKGQCYYKVGCKLREGKNYLSFLTYCFVFFFSIAQCLPRSLGRRASVVSAEWNASLVPYSISVDGGAG